MNLRRIGWLLTALTLAAGGFAAAQEAATLNDEQAATEEATAATGVRRRADLTPEEQVAEGQRLLANAQGLSTRVQSMLDEARRQADILRVTCVDDKLTQVNAHIRTLEERVQSLSEAVRLNDADRVSHEYTVITVLGQNITQLDRGASECIGSELYETGTTRVVTTVDPGSPTENPAELPWTAPEGVPFIPPPASAR